MFSSSPPHARQAVRYYYFAGTFCFCVSTCEPIHRADARRIIHRGRCNRTVPGYIMGRENKKKKKMHLHKKILIIISLQCRRVLASATRTTWPPRQPVHLSGNNDGFVLATAAASRDAAAAVAVATAKGSRERTAEQQMTGTAGEKIARRRIRFLLIINAKLLYKLSIIRTHLKRCSGPVRHLMKTFRITAVRRP